MTVLFVLLSVQFVEHGLILLKLLCDALTTHHTMSHISSVFIAVILQKKKEKEITKTKMQSGILLHNHLFIAKM